MKDDRIIGGEYAIDVSRYQSLGNNLFQGRLFSCGRAALAAILDHIGGGKRLLVPDYLCTSITNTVRDIGWQYSFYHIDEESLLPKDILEKNLQDFDAVLLIDYFGMTDVSGCAAEIKKHHASIKIIEDDVQDFFNDRKNPDIDYYFTSFRKWFAVPDGAQVFSKIEDELPGRIHSNNEFAQYKFAGNLLKQYRDDIDDSVCLELLKKGEDILDQNYLCECSDITRRLLPKMDFEEIKKKRMENGQVLHEGLTKMNIRHKWAEGKTPFFIPIFIHERDSVRKIFFKNNMFMPVHWPKKSRELSGENPLYETELSLICDQRYSADDMKKILEVLKDAV